MENRQGRFLFLFIAMMFALCGPRLNAQVFLQLERVNIVDSKKYQLGDKVFFKTKAYPDYWQGGKIMDILPQDNALVFDDRITYVNDITYFKYYRRWPQAIGANLMRFGVAWTVFGGIIEGGRAAGILDTNYKFGVDTAAIGLGSFVTGFLIQKIWAVSIKKINDRNRLRIIDVRL